MKNVILKFRPLDYERVFFFLPLRPIHWSNRVLSASVSIFRMVVQSVWFKMAISSMLILKTEESMFNYPIKRWKNEEKTGFHLHTRLREAFFTRFVPYHLYDSHVQNSLFFKTIFFNEIVLCFQYIKSVKAASKGCVTDE